MKITEAVSAVLLVGGLLIVAASCIGMAVMSDPVDRLHLVTPAAMLGAAGVCAAVVVHAGLSASGLAAIVVAVIVAGTSPFTSHAMARSILVRRRAAEADGHAQASGAADDGRQGDGGETGRGTPAGEGER